MIKDMPSQLRIKFIKNIDMRIERKTLTKWEISQPNFEERIVINPNARQQKYRDQQLRTMFGLPRSIVESPKLGQLKKMVQDKYASKLNKQSINEMGPAGKYLYNNFRSTLANHTNQRCRPLRKHNSLLDTYEFNPAYLGQKQNQLQANRHIDNDGHTSHNTLELLQKIIFKQDNGPQKKEIKMQLHANKLPIIENSKELKRKQSQSIYQQKYFAKTLLNRQPFYIKPRQKVRPSEKPYLSGWETESRNW